MTDVLDRAFADPAQAGTEGQSKGESQQQEQPAATPDATAEGNGAPPATENTEKHVPLAALEAVRTERKDWKEKALRYEGELTALRRLQQPERQQEQRQISPEEVVAQRAETLFLDLSEKAAIKEHGKEAVDAAYEWLAQESQKNPALAQQVLSGRDPYGDAIALHKRHIALSEIGEDPAAYRARVRAEIEAELRGTVQPPPVKLPAAPLPKSLADARSSGSPRTTWTGPTPLNAIL